MERKILIIEDEEDIQNILKAFLEDVGYYVHAESDGVNGLAALHNDTYDMVLLDIMLPKIDGYAVCETVRKESDIPIIILSALDEESYQMKGYDLLADDYITKPFSMPLVLKHIEAIFRRTQRNNNDNNSMLYYRDIVLDVNSFSVRVSGETITLTAKEFDILKLFMQNPGQVFSREQLLSHIWDYDFLGDQRIINTHIKNIRKKLGINCIETIRGVGYRIDKEN